jgi:hypothetical protein
MGEHDPAAIPPEGRIAGGRECEHCPYQTACLGAPIGDKGHLAPEERERLEVLRSCVGIEERNIAAAEAGIARLRETAREILRSADVRRVPGVCSVRRSSRTSLDTEALARDGVDLDKYRKPGKVTETLSWKLTTVNDNAFAAFEAAAASLSGGDQKPILKFQKGDWYLGQENEEIPNGTKLAANIMEAEWGWVRWSDGKPVERRMVRIATGAQAPTRDTLGHLDKELWDRDNAGQAARPLAVHGRHPGARDRRPEARGAALRRVEGLGGLLQGAVRRLRQGDARERRQDADRPARGRQVHPPGKEYGVVKTPKLELVEWKAAAELEQKPAKIATKF